MKFSLVLYLFVLVFSTPLLAIEVTIDASKLKKVSPLYVSASGISSLIPESGVVTVNVAQLPDIVRLVERKKSRLITIRSIWILGDKLTLSGSVEENTIAVDADSQAALLPKNPCLLPTPYPSTVATLPPDTGPVSLSEKPKMVLRQGFQLRIMVFAIPLLCLGAVVLPVNQHRLQLCFLLPTLIR